MRRHVVGIALLACAACSEKKAAPTPAPVIADGSPGSTPADAAAAVASDAAADTRAATRPPLEAIDATLAVKERKPTAEKDIDSRLAEAIAGLEARPRGDRRVGVGAGLAGAGETRPANIGAGSRRAPAPGAALAFRVEILDSPLTGEQIERVVRSRRGALRACYERELVRQPTLSGGLKALVTIAVNGRVASAEVTRSLSPRVDACVRRQLSRVRFPASDRESRFKLLLQLSKRP